MDVNIARIKTPSQKEINAFISRKKKEMSEKMKKIDARKFNLSIYPGIIKTMILRLNRMEPWKKIFQWNEFDATMIIYYKFLQLGLDETEIVVNNVHSWIEFMFLKEKYIFDIQAVFNLDAYGLPIKRKKEKLQPVYKMLSKRYSNVDDFINVHKRKLTLTKDEAKIESMEDDVLNNVIIIKNNLE